jgi:hypothetical protein
MAHIQNGAGWRNIAISLISRLLTDEPDGTRIERSRNLSVMACFRQLRVCLLTNVQSALTVAHQNEGWEV